MPITTTPFKLFEPFEVSAKGVQKRRSFRFDINALADFEQVTGMGFGQLMSTKAVFATARALLWAGLKHEDRTLTVEDAGRLLSRYIKEGKGSIDVVLTACFEAANEQGAFGETGTGDSDSGNDELDSQQMTLTEASPSSSAVPSSGPIGSEVSNPSRTET